MSTKIDMIATQTQRFARKRLDVGDPLKATQRECNTLLALQRAVLAPPKQVAALLKAPATETNTEPKVEFDQGSYETRVMEAAAPRAKRPYTRRNQTVAA